MTTEEARVELAKSVPALRAMKDALPRVPEQPEALMVCVEDETIRYVVSDDANEVAHVFDYPADMNPETCMGLSRNRIHAPFN